VVRCKSPEPSSRIAQIFLLQQHKDRHHQDDADRRRRGKQRLQDTLADLDYGRGRLGYHDRDRLLLLSLRRCTGRSGRRRFRARRGTGELTAEAAELFGEFVDRSIP
jgi:hypothetical protein